MSCVQRTMEKTAAAKMERAEGRQQKRQQQNYAWGGEATSQAQVGLPHQLRL